MKRFYLPKLILLMAVLGMSTGSFAQTTVFTFNGTTTGINAGTGGTVQTYVVGPGITKLGIDAIGPQGGKPYTSSGGGINSFGGRVQCSLSVTPGQTLYIYVGGAGGDDGVGGSGGTVAPGGWNGGQPSQFYAGGSAGATDIRLAAASSSSGTQNLPYTATNRIVVAGGGGAGADWAGTGGAGGGLVGGTGLVGTAGGTPGSGGTQSGPGPTGSTFGTLGIGGASSTYGAGGAGYWGGNGGIGTSGGGGGGSSYTDPVLCTGVIHTQGYSGASGNGKVTITVLCTTPLAGTVTGTTTMCLGTNTTLTDSRAYSDGQWTSSNPSVASVGTGSGFVTSVAVGTAVISFQTVRGCGTATDTATVRVNPVVTAFTGNTNICTSNTTLFTATPTGGVWTSSNPSLADVNSSSGVVTGYIPGFATVSYTLPTGCFSTRGIAIYASPSAITGTTTVCQGLTTTLSDATTGGNWSTSNAGVASINSVSGVVSGVSAGTAKITYTMTTGGCTATTTVNVNALPTASTVTATSGNSFCSGAAGVPVGLNGSTFGTNYQLYINGVAGPVMSGTGGAFDFGNQTAAGMYTATAIDPSTGCTNNMTGSQTLTINPLPSVFSVTTPGGSSYCAGGMGVPVGLSGSSSGVNYVLSMGSTSAGSASGSGSAITFGSISGVGTYTVMATDGTTGCTKAMAGNATIAINPLPTAYSMTGGGHYCSGGTGSDVSLSYSSSGINYQLYNGSAPVGTAVAGIDAPLDFGLQTNSGTYHVTATNTTTGCVNNMSGVAVVSIDLLPAPAAVSGGGHYCTGGTGVLVGLGSSASGVDYQLLLAGSAVGSAVPGTGSTVTFGLQTGGGTYTAVATNRTTGCSSNMPGSATITLDPLPTPYIVTGGGNYCTGGTGMHVGLSSSDAGIEYQLYYMGSPIGATVAGTGAAIDFGLKTASGNYTVGAKNTTTLCTSNMTGSVTITLNPLPTVFSVTGGGNYCTGGIGMHVGLSFSNTGVLYQLKKDGVAQGSPTTGTGAALDFGLQTATGTYTVMANNTITTCSAPMAGSVTITTSSLPAPYGVTGGGNYCSGGVGVHAGLAASNTGISYQLYNGTLPVGTAMRGSGSPLDFGLQTISGTYTVMATNTVTGCASNMTGSATVNVNSLPDPYTVSGGGGYCQGTTGVHIGLGNGEPGVNYQLMRGTTAVGSALPGTGSAIDFGLKTTAGAYTVVATNPTTTCTSNMSGSAVVVINPLPVVYTATGGGNICSGAAGLHITISGSNAGIGYQLYNGTTGMGSSMSGTGGTIDFGAQTAGGTYTVLATDLTSGCTANMAGTPVITVTTAPTPYTVTGGGSYCAGSIGVHVGITATDRGANYQLYNGTTAVGIPWHGTGGPLDFGTYALPGTYSVMALDAGTGCGASMATTVPVSITSLAVPMVTVMSDSGLTVCSATPVTYNAATVNGGTTPSYQWSVGGTAVAGATNATFSVTPVNGDIVSVMMTSNAACATPATVTNALTMTVLPSGMPTVTTVATPGNRVCAGTPVIFSATPVLGGTAPTFTWKSGGTTIGTGLAITYIPANGENISVNMTSNYVCRLGNVATSSNITMSIQAPVAPTFTISGNTTTGLHMYDTLKATVTANGGTTPTYQWAVNGTPVAGAVFGTFVYNQFNNHDSVSCTVMSDGPCGGAAATHGVMMNVLNLGVSTLAGSSNVAVVPNPSKGTFTVKGVLGTESEEVILEVTNMLGQVVYSNKVLTSNGNIEQMIQLGNTVSDGMYLLNLRSGSDNKVFHIVIDK